MSDHSPGVPSPPEELRQEIAAALLTANFLRGNEFDAAVLAEKVLPLFEARVAAIEAENHNLLHDVRTATLRARTYAERIDRAEAERDEARAEVKAWVENFREGFAASERMRIAAEAERDRFREHSVQLNTIGWKLAEAVGDVGAGDTEVGGDRQERLARLVADRDEARVKADNYRRMYYGEHGETAAELTALQQRVAELTAERSPLEKDFPCRAEGPDGAACRLRYGHAIHVSESHIWTDAWQPEQRVAAERTQAAPEPACCEYAPHPDLSCADVLDLRSTTVAPARAPATEEGGGPAKLRVVGSAPDDPIHQATPAPAEPRRRCGPWTETSPGVSRCEKCGDINFALDEDEPSAGQATPEEPS